jgi:hypothetical protein
LLEKHLWFLVDPVVLGGLPRLDFTLLEPESDLLLGILNTVRAVTNVPAHVDSIIASYCAWLRSKGVGGAEESWVLLVV